MFDVSLLEEEREYDLEFVCALLIEIRVLQRFARHPCLLGVFKEVLACHFDDCVVSALAREWIQIEQLHDQLAPPTVGHAVSKEFLVLLLILNAF